MAVDDEETRLHEWRRHAKRTAEASLEDLDPAMLVREWDTQECAGRVVGALEVIEEAEPSDPEEDDESDYVTGSELDRAEGVDVEVDWKS